jgi:hypothetical protein
MLSVIMLSAVMLSVIMLSVIMLSVMAPVQFLFLFQWTDPRNGHSIPLFFFEKKVKVSTSKNQLRPGQSYKTF